MTLKKCKICKKPPIVYDVGASLSMSSGHVTVTCCGVSISKNPSDVKISANYGIGLSGWQINNNLLICCRKEVELIWNKIN